MVYVVEDDDVSAHMVGGIATKAGFSVQRYSSAEEVLQKLPADARGCIVADIKMAGMDGLALQRELALRGVRLPVIVVSGHAEVSSAVVAMKQKAFDFFEKPVDSPKLLIAIQRAVDEDARQQQHQQVRDQQLTRYRTLTPREREVMQLVVEGLANKQVAARLGLSEKTIEVHRGNVMRKMQVDSVADLVRASILCQETTV